MTKWSYVAIEHRDGSLRERRGIIDAISAKQAVFDLAERGLYVRDLKNATDTDIVIERLKERRKKLAGVCSVINETENLIVKSSNKIVPVVLLAIILAFLIICYFLEV